MNHEIEIEFKNMLSKTKYDELLTIFDIQEGEAVRQENHYFDTADFQLKAIDSGLRIRILPNKIECTLKEKATEHTYIETTDILTEEEASRILQGSTFTAPTVIARLQERGIAFEQLILFGTLATERVEIPYKEGLLVLDHSFYLQREDYEVEYEAQDETVGRTVFQQFLTNYNIPIAHADKKIARFAAALADKNN
ncbi:CYTH domain-containing protein [Metasolibacillus fluoroglycofenilyticus]|uniref:CYTH domain-containing protein n=1 Tax=Metasolibacillus fluoroglycofenilyticus TaxID=1239396 RepID=UPI000D39365D|nr:CYTH domain-containing protein [Metasolibacillus fluoroglycofenilyticus]